MPQPLPIHSWKLIFPCEVSAVKLGASSFMRNMNCPPEAGVIIHKLNAAHFTRETNDAVACRWADRHRLRPAFTGGTPRGSRFTLVYSTGRNPDCELGIGTGKSAS